MFFIIIDNIQELGSQCIMIDKLLFYNYTQVERNLNKPKKEKNQRTNVGTLKRFDAASPTVINKYHSPLRAYLDQ